MREASANTDIVVNSSNRSCTLSSSPRWQLHTADVTGISARMLNDALLLESTLRRCLEAAGFSPAQWVSHQFEPRGASVVALGATLRLVVHTWPERGIATLDLWTSSLPAERIVDLCVRALRPDES
jgi:S-adenosylmethionine decarboxylase